MKLEADSIEDDGTVQYCKMCRRPLDQPDDPTTEDCGGDCLRCMAEAGDDDCEEAMRKIEVESLRRRNNAAIAAIEFAIETDDGLEFLRAWMHGEFPEIRSDWPAAPEAVFIGADPLFESTKLVRQGASRYLAAWGTGYVKPGTKEVGIEFFTDDLGYHNRDRDAIAALGVGQTCLLDAGDHAVTRLS